MRVETNVGTPRHDLRARRRDQLEVAGSRQDDLGLCRAIFRNRKSADRPLNRAQKLRICKKKIVFEI